MNVLEKDMKRKKLLEMMVAHCTYEIVINNQKARETGMNHYYKESKEWAFELRECHDELNEIFLRAEQDMIENPRIFGRI